MVAGYHNLLHFVQTALLQLRVTRQRNLALTVLAPYGSAMLTSQPLRSHARSLVVPVTGRFGHWSFRSLVVSVTGRFGHWHKFKRIWRFLSNARWDPAGHFDDPVKFVLSRYRPGPFLPIIIDQSTIAGKWEVLWTSIPFRGRPLPIRYRVFRYADIQAGDERSQNRIEEQFIRHVTAMIPRPLRPLLLLDRGYARAALVRLLQWLEVSYVIRVRGDTWVQHGEHEGAFSGVPISSAAGEALTGRGHSTGRGPPPGEVDLRVA